MWPSWMRSPMLYVRTGKLFPALPQEVGTAAAVIAATNRWVRIWRMWQDYCHHAAGRVSIGTGPRRHAFLPGLLLLQEALELLALCFGEHLLHAAAAVADHDPVILPQIVEDRLHLHGFFGRQLEFLLDAGEVLRLAGRGIEGGLMEMGVRAEAHDDGAGGGSA